jgi:CO/xanthine dehydrogenase FAD-binding subunit
MISEYYRPESIDEALRLLARKDALIVPLGGGSVLSRENTPNLQIAVVDLQNLGLDQIIREGQLLKVGAAVTLEQLAQCEDLPPSLRESLILEAGLNQRQVATIAGTIISCDGRSPFITALLALDPRLVWSGSEEQESLGDFLVLRAANPLETSAGRLMTEIRIPLNAGLRFENVGRTPLDRSIVCAAAARWPSGRTRVTLGGYGSAPVLAMDGPEPVGAAAAARDAYLGANDQWASAEYRAHVAATLSARLLQE